MRRLLLALAALALALPIAPAHAGDNVLNNDTETVAWDGRAYTTSDVPVPDTFEFEIALPAAYWTTHDGGVEVAVRWASEYNTFDLYVLNLENQVLASATGFPTSAESLILPEPVNGTYQVIVVPQVQVDDAYEGIVQVELKPDTGPGVGLVPDLVALPPDNFRIASRTYSFTPIDNPLGSCYPDEQLDAALASQPELTRCLRFDTAVANLGAGPFELTLDVATLGSDHQDVFQDIYDRDGNVVSTSYAGGYTFHKTHGHMHYQNFATYTLYKWENNALGDMVSSSRKADFCMIDTRLLWFGAPKGNGPRNHHFPNCNVPGSEGNSAPTVMRQGIDVGWADVYTFDLPGQYIDISSLEPGDYAVVVKVNPEVDGYPDGILQELSKSNNTATSVIHIDAAGVTQLP